MAENKTKETTNSVLNFISAVENKEKQKDCFDLIEIIKAETNLEPKLWGPSIVGFGSYHYKYESGREGDSPLVAFSPRSTSIAIYLSGSFENREELLTKLGKHKTDKGCVHIKKLGDISIEVLKEMVGFHVKHIKELHPEKTIK